MSWSVTDFLLIFLFVFAATGIPFGDEPKAESNHVIPSQWGKDTEISFHWPKGEVSYVFDDKSYDDDIKSRVRIVMAALQRDSCIRFKEVKKGKTDGSWLHFTNPNALRPCSHEPSYKAKGEIQVVLGYDCLRQRDLIHAVLHGVGFRDEVSHPQRDLFVKIMWANIQPAYKSMFRIQPVEHAGGLVEYDPMSIMHFHERAYSLNGQATITPLLPGLKIAPSDNLSHLDKMKLRIMFGHECNKRKVSEVLNKCEGILSQYDKSELTPNKNTQDNVQSDDDAKDDSTGNKVEGLNKNTNVEEEIIIVGNEGVGGISGNDNPKKDDADNDQNENPEESAFENINEEEVQNQNNNNIENINVNKNEELIIVSNGNPRDDNQNENPINSEERAYLNDDIKDDGNVKVDNEIVIVGKDKKGDSPEDAKGNITYNDALVQEAD